MSFVDVSSAAMVRMEAPYSLRDGRVCINWMYICKDLVVLDCCSESIIRSALREYVCRWLVGRRGEITTPDQLQVRYYTSPGRIALYISFTFTLYIDLNSNSTFIVV